MQLFFLQQVLVFAEKKQDVDAIHEYLLLKGVEAAAIHGGKGKNILHHETSILHTPIAQIMCQSK